MTINGKNFNDKPVNSDITWCKAIGQGEDYTKGSLLNHEHLKRHYRLIAVDLGRQKELEANPKPIQQI